MADVKIKSMLTDKSESQQKVPIKIFKITDIPGVMEKKVGLSQLALCGNGSVIHFTR